VIDVLAKLEERSCLSNVSSKILTAVAASHKIDRYLLRDYRRVSQSGSWKSYRVGSSWNFKGFACYESANDYTGQRPITPLLALKETIEPPPYALIPNIR
jgi:hypothetical protein